ncbi:Integral membrane protein Sra family [Trichostrongylus colubriformis]|uniref:Integral membrane protein Sra family n=1 Tax=Trichostrongylus colubriformis TaxID=6319 RepID=A0AAN8FIG8_TRICO
MRFPTTACMTSFAILQTGMVVERAIALWKRNEYEHYGNRLGFVNSTLCVLSSLLLTAWSLRDMDLTTFTVYCTVSTNETAGSITILCFILCGIDIMSLVGIALLHISNATAMKGEYSDLQSSYQLHENATALRLILPLVLFNGICHLAFSMSAGVFLIFRQYFSYVAYRTIFAATYTVPYFTLVSPFLICFMIRKSKRARLAQLSVLRKQQDHEKELYFKAYNRMWNNS